MLSLTHHIFKKPYHSFHAANRKHEIEVYRNVAYFFTTSNHPKNIILKGLPAWLSKFLLFFFLGVPVVFISIYSSFFSVKTWSLVKL